LTKAKADKKTAEMILLDFAKAFDKVPHKRLLLKLDSYGISGSLVKWIEAFLTNRKQRLVLGDTCSVWKDVTSGVPQGSVLGPSLFVIFINDLPDCVSDQTVFKLFADDSNLLRIINDSNDHLELQKDLLAVSHWTTTWLMELNAKKCKVMHFASRQDSSISPYFIEELDHGSTRRTNLDYSSSERNLGVQITTDLKQHEQASMASTKAISILGMLKNAFTSRDPLLWTKLYTTYVRPHLEFAVQSWNPHLIGDIKLLEQVQHRATRIPHSLKGKSYDARCRFLGLTSLKERRLRGDLIEQYKLDRSIELINWHHPIDRVHRGDHARIHRELVKNCNERFFWFGNRVANYWNALPDDVKKAKSTNDFKNRLDKIDNLLTLNTLRLAR
jgi:hypothetical protein